MGTEFYSYDSDERFALYDPADLVEKISDQDFNLYYTIDRTLFYRLVHKLGRNVIESMQVVAFLIWLEKIRYSHKAVLKVIAWPFHLLDQLSNEIAGFLRCLERKEIGREYICLHSVRKLCSLHIDLFGFHAKRIEILESVRKIVSVVCKRAFKDILTCGSEFVDVEGDRMWDAHNNLVIVPPPFYHYVGGGFSHLGFRGNFRSDNFMAPANNVQNVLEDTNADHSEMFGGMQLGNSLQEPDREPDDRTIFLTFSKGCYIPEMEIREFFTRIFGDFVEGIYMQDVSSDEQPLYARMVCRSSAIISNIAPPNRKTNYSINGKRISASKYIKRRHR